MNASDQRLCETGHPGWFALGIVSLVAFLFLWLLPVSFNVADDVGAQMILAGLDGFEAGAEVPFHSYSLSLTIQYLYALVPAIPWYGLLVMVTSVIGSSVWLSCMLAHNVCRRDRLIMLPAVSFLLAHCLYSPTFTSAALLCQLGAYACLAFHSPHQLARPGVRLALLGLVLLAALWRWQLSCYCLVLLLPVTLVRPRHWRMSLGLLVATLLLVGADRSIQSQAQPEPAQRDYERFHRLRAAFHDWPAGRDPKQAAFDAAGWEAGDYQMFRHLWVLHDDQLFNAETLEKFLEANRQSSGGETTGLAGHLVQTLRDNALSLRIMVPTLLALFVAQLATGSWRATDRRWLRLVALVLAVLPLIFLWYFRLVPRVAIPLLMFLLVFLSKSGEREPGSSAEPLAGLTRSLVLVGVALAVICGGRMVQLELNQQGQAQAELAQVDQALNQLANQHPVATLVRMNTGGSVRHAAMHPLVFPEGIRRLRLIPSGWQTGSPRYRLALRQLGIHSGRQLLVQAVDSGPIVLVDYVKDPAQHAEVLRLWESYYERHIVPGSRLRFETVLGSATNPGPIVYRIRSW